MYYKERIKRNRINYKKREENKRRPMPIKKLRSIKKRRNKKNKKL